MGRRRCPNPAAPGCWAADEQSVVDIAIASEDDGSTLVGVMTYDGEGPIGLRAFWAE